MSKKKTDPEEDKNRNKTGPAEKIARSGNELAEQAAEIHRKASYAGLSMTSKLRGKGNNLLDSLIDIVETTQVSTLEAIDNSQDKIGESVNKIAKALDESLNAIEDEITETAKGNGLPSPAKPLRKSADRVASAVKGAQKGVTRIAKNLGANNQEEKEWNDDDLADW